MHFITILNSKKNLLTMSARNAAGGNCQSNTTPPAYPASKPQFTKYGPA